MKVRATHFAEDIAKVNWQGIPAEMKKDAEDLKQVAKYYADGGDFKAGIDNYVSALNKKLVTAKPAAKAKRKVQSAPGKGTVSKAKAKRSVKQSAATKKKKAAEIAAAKRDVQTMQNQAKKGEFSKFSRSQILEYAQLFHKRRRLSAQVVDESVDHKKRLTPTPENLVRWMKDPGKFDLIGVDTFEKNNPTADLKIKKEIFWHRLLKK